jgi:uncharacterized protein
MSRRPALTMTLFFALACAITWVATLPLVTAWIRGEEPPGHALGLAALAAFGPTFAALIVGRWSGERPIFGRFSGNLGWALVALLTPAAAHLVANGLEVALGGQPAQWFYPPVTPEHVAALVLFSVGEEPGWRGFAYPRMARLAGPVAGSAILGAGWGLWHLTMMVTPQGDLPDPLILLRTMVELAAWSVVIAWFSERTGRSLFVAMCLHAGAHLDNVSRAPTEEVRLVVLRLGVTLAAAALAGWSLRRRPPIAT